MVLINNNATQQTVATDRFKENIGSFTKGEDVITKQAIGLQKEIKMEPKSILILELQ